ncbi:MAG TPA: sigma-70 family RNA polymerase sigma factor [Jiangellales bacterium]|nr:sigma-70 family RNA polymerase sigma factor [Jiangellales bacterium]
MTTTGVWKSDPEELVALVARAAEGRPDAWEALVDRFVRLVWDVTSEYRLSESDRADVCQTTWLRLLEHIDRLQDPARVGSWLATTARRECLAVLAQRKRVLLSWHDQALEDVRAEQPPPEQSLLAAERVRDVHEAVDKLPPLWRTLMRMLMADPRPSYAEISARLGVPVGSIGPTRGRCMQRLRVLLDEA